MQFARKVSNGSARNTRGSTNCREQLVFDMNFADEFFKKAKDPFHCRSSGHILSTTSCVRFRGAGFFCEQLAKKSCVSSSTRRRNRRAPFSARLLSAFSAYKKIIVSIGFNGKLRCCGHASSLANNESHRIPTG